MVLSDDQYVGSLLDMAFDQQANSVCLLYNLMTIASF
jgi:hypothetical protein